MKRPFAVVGLTYLAAQIVAVLCGLVVSATLAVLCFIATVLCIALWSRRPQWVMYLLIPATAALSIYSIYYAAAFEPARLLDGQTAAITGRMIQEPYEQNGRCYCVIRTDSIGVSSAPQKIKLRLSMDTAPEVNASDMVSAYVVFNRQKDAQGFASPSRLLAEGISATAYLPYGGIVNKTGEKRDIRSLFAKFRSELKQSADSLFPDDIAALLSGMALGDTSDIDSSALRDFRLCGLSHLLAVSGLHLSVLLYVLRRALRFAGLGQRTESGISIGFVVFYMALTGFSVSILRAGIMCIIALLANVLLRDHDPINSLGVSVLAICLFSPMAAADVSLLLSAVSTLGLVLVSTPAEKLLCDMLRTRFEDEPRLRTALLRLLPTVVTTMTATLFTLPISALYFGEISLISPLCNMLCCPLASACMATGSAAVLISCIPLVGGVLGVVIAAPAWLFARVLLILVHILAAVPNAGVSVSFSFLPVLLCGAILLAVVWAVFFRREKRRMLSIVLCCAFILQAFMTGVLTERIIESSNACVTVFDVGSGMAVALRSHGRCIMIGCGGDRYLDWQAVCELNDAGITRVDALVVPDEDDGSTSYCAEFIEMFRPDTVFLPDECSAVDRISYSAEQCGSAVYSVCDAHYELKGAKLAVRSYTDEAGCKWIYANADGVDILICPSGGDINALPEDMRSPDAVIMPDDNIGGVTRLHAAAFILSADEKNGGQCAARLRYRGVSNVLTTGTDGTLTVYQKHDGVQIIC